MNLIQNMTVIRGMSIVRNMNLYRGLIQNMNGVYIAFASRMFNCIKSNKKTIPKLSFVLVSRDFPISCHLYLKVPLEVKVESNNVKNVI